MPVVKGVTSDDKIYPILIDIDDDNIADSQNAQVVICLMYVYDVANSKWVRKPL